MSHSNTISTNGRMYRFQPGSNTFQQPFIRWKGKTFTQIFATLKKNTYSLNTRTTPAILQYPLPLKLVRKEFANIPQSQRTNVKIDDFNMPNGAFITNLPPTTTGFSATTLDINYVNNLTEHPGMCKSFDNGKACMTTENNARHRVRSAGMYPKKFNTNRNNDSVYHSSTNDYLVSRTKTFQQNQFQYFRSGVDNKYKTGQNYQSYFNDYSPQGIPHCYYSGNISTTPLSQLPHRKVVYKPNNWKFGTQGGVESSGLTSHKNTLCNRMCVNHSIKKEVCNKLCIKSLTNVFVPPVEPENQIGIELVENGDFSYYLRTTRSYQIYSGDTLTQNDSKYGWFLYVNSVNNLINTNIGYNVSNNSNLSLGIGKPIIDIRKTQSTTHPNVGQLYQYINIFKGTYNFKFIYYRNNNYVLYIKIMIDDDIIGYINPLNTISSVWNEFSTTFYINTPRRIKLTIEVGDLPSPNIFAKRIVITNISLKQVNP